MKQFFLIGLFLVLVWALDVGIGLIASSCSADVKVGTLGVVNNALNDSSRVLILGSSRALHHYDSKLMEKALGVSCYNAGLGGHGLLYSYAILSERMLRNKPEMVILDISPNVLIDPNWLGKLAIFLPFIDSSDVFAEIVEINPDITFIAKFMNSLKYNSILYELVLNEVVDTTPYKGYVPLDGMLRQNTYTPKFANGDSINAMNKKYLGRIIETCRQNSVLPIIVISPSYEDFDSSGAIKKFLAVFAEANRLTMIDYSSSDVFCGNERFFKDQLHLNRRGAESFTDDLCLKIVPIWASAQAMDGQVSVAGGR